MAAVPGVGRLTHRTEGVEAVPGGPMPSPLELVVREATGEPALLALAQATLAVEVGAGETE
jgi:hypothetical protein